VGDANRDADLVGAGRVAVVTGAASGIGRAMAERFAGEGMRVVMADIEEPALSEAAALVERRGGEVLPVRTDVSRPEQVDALRDRALDAFGAVHVVCNNAGVGGWERGVSIWELTLTEWDWVLGVNLWGVIHGMRTFLPVLLEQPAAHVVNTASIAGLIPARGPYGVSKHGVVALSEGLSLELRQRGAAVGVSVLCPGYVKTRILESARNRPDTVPSPGSLRVDDHPLLRSGIEPAVVADRVVDAIRAGRFYVLTHEDSIAAVRRRADQVVAGDLPSRAAG